MSDAAIDLQHVAKTYRGNVQALRGISLSVRPGEIFGLLGPNGAGKSTLVKILMTVIHATRAQGTLLGRPIGDKATLRRVGYLPESHRFPRYLTGRQTLDFFAALSGMPRAHRRRRAEELLETVGMAADARRVVATYSKGMMQRVGLASALMHDPDLVLLDEPTDGVDPLGRLDIRRVLQNLRGQGKTIFINSHQLSELDVLCDRVAMLSAGQVIREGTVDQLTRDQQAYELELAPDGPDFAARLTQALRELPPATPTYSMPTPGTLLLHTTDATVLQPLLDLLRARGFVVRRLAPVRPTLEDLFVSVLRQPPAPPPN